MKWLYIKNGDVITQLKRLPKAGESLSESGPDAFLADFILGIKDQPALFISQSSQNAEFIDGSHRAITFMASGSSFGRMGNALLRSRAMLLAAKQLISFKPERIICGRIGPMLWMTAFISSWLHCPFIHSRHNSLFEQQSRWYQRLFSRLDTYAIRKAKAVICHGPFLAEQMKSLGVDTHRVIEFDVGFKRFQERLGSNLGLYDAANKQVILYVGRIARSKGVFDLLHSSLPLLEGDKNLLLKYVGDGADLDKLKSLIDNSKFKTQIECLGNLTHDELPSHINSSYIMVTPTLREFPEGRCMAVMEALACSIPVVAPDYGPFPYLVRTEINGLLYEADNVDELANSLTRVFNEEGLYQQLKMGAAKSAIELQTPIRTFYQAVDHAFGL